MNNNDARLREMAAQIRNIQEIFPQAEPAKQEEFADQAMPLLSELENILNEIVVIQQRERNSTPPE
jgi:hypothetical protein